MYCQLPHSAPKLKATNKHHKMSTSPKCLIWDSFTTKNWIQREYVLICNTSYTTPHNITRQPIKTSPLSTFLWSTRYEPRPEIHLPETIWFFLREIPAKDKQQMSHAHACLSIHPQKYGTPVFLRGFYEEQVKRRQTQWEMCWRKWSREPWIICVEGWVSAMSYSIRVWPAHRESNLRVEAVRHIDDMSYKKGLRLCFTRTALCSCPDVHLEIWSSLRRFWDICIRKSLLR